MPRNLELKARIPSLRRAARIAHTLATRCSGTFRQIDTYFQVSRGRLKLREHSPGRAELIFYHRLNRRSARTSQYAIVPIANPRSLKPMLSTALGVKAVVKKQRALYLFRNARIHLDRVAGLGTFIEFEVLITRGRRQASSLMNMLSNRFGVRADDLVAESYSDFLLSTKKRKIL
jgi:predicted adenylyl cyclase CyaB